MEKVSDLKSPKSMKQQQGKSFFKASNPDLADTSCENCIYGQQDIDTDPCAKCHTRH